MEIAVSFESPSYRLSGLMHLPEPRAVAPCIVMCHGFTGSRVEAHRLFVQAARAFASRGFAVLRFDFRGSGESEGEFWETTFQGEVEDLREALTFTLSHPSVDSSRVGVVGLSLGGAVAICTLARDLRARALATWSSIARLSELLGSYLSNFPRVELGDGQEGVDLGNGFQVGRGFLEDLPRHSPLRDVSAIAPRPLLIIHGTGDNTVPPSEAKLLYKKAGEPKRLVYIARADHTFTSRADKLRVIEETSRFFEHSL